MLYHSWIFNYKLLHLRWLIKPQHNYQNLLTSITHKEDYFLKMRTTQYLLHLTWSSYNVSFTFLRECMALVWRRKKWGKSLCLLSLHLCRLCDFWMRDLSDSPGTTAIRIEPLCHEEVKAWAWRVHSEVQNLSSESTTRNVNK